MLLKLFFISLLLSGNECFLGELNGKVSLEEEWCIYGDRSILWCTGSLSCCGKTEDPTCCTNEEEALMSVGAIAGIIIGVALVTGGILMATILCCCCFDRQRTTISTRHARGLPVRRSLMLSGQHAGRIVRTNVRGPRIYPSDEYITA